MPRLAVMVPYAENQNEPSKPFGELYTLPDDKEERDTLLRAVFYERVYDDEDEPLAITEEEGGEYSDITVAAKSVSVFMHVTFVEP